MDFAVCMNQSRHYIVYNNRLLMSSTQDHENCIKYWLTKSLLI